MAISSQLIHSPVNSERFSNDIADLDDFLRAFDEDDSFAYAKINHDFWDELANVEAKMGWPSNDEERAAADVMARRPFWFRGGFVDDLLALLQSTARDHPPSLHLCFSLQAWYNDDRIRGRPFRPELSRPFLARHASAFRRLGNGLLLKQAVLDGSIARLFERLPSFRVILVGPEKLSPFFEFLGIRGGAFLPIHQTRARERRDEIEREIRAALAEKTTRPRIVCLQAGTLAPWWIVRLHRDYPGVRWVDGGKAWDICNPSQYLKREDGRIYRKEVVRTYNALRGEAVLPERDLFAGVSAAVAENADPPLPPALATEVAFVEEKVPDLARVAQLLELPARQNHWTNRGPLHRALAQAYHAFFGLGPERAVVPVANGGVALETLARLHDARFGKRLRWVVSAFSFRNLGRGYFANAAVVDCDARGMLSLRALAALPLDAYDGIVVTNPFGLGRDFDAYRAFAEKRGKTLLLDNAAGICRDIPPVEYQSMSLHHTKPFGVGEGGLAVLPAAEVENYFQLLDYRAMDGAREAHWLNNGKLSDVACAFHLDRLERAPEWLVLYEMQTVRILHVARRAGLKLLSFPSPATIATSLPFLAPRPVAVAELANPLLALGKYYLPLDASPQASALHARMVNIPAHPDVARLDTDDLVAMLKRFAAN